MPKQPETYSPVLPLKDFIPRIIRTQDGIYFKLLEINHGFEKHTAEEWQAIIDKYKKKNT